MAKSWGWGPSWMMRRGWEKQGAQKTTPQKTLTSTLPETNIAMENPPFWWYLPGKMVIFMGYVSLPEGKRQKAQEWWGFQVPTVSPFWEGVDCAIFRCKMLQFWGVILYTFDTFAVNWGTHLFTIFLGTSQSYTLFNEGHKTVEIGSPPCSIWRITYCRPSPESCLWKVQLPPGRCQRPVPNLQHRLTGVLLTTLTRTRSSLTLQTGMVVVLVVVRVLVLVVVLVGPYAW